MFRELKYSARILAKKRGFTVVALLTLALAIGANTAIFTVVDLVLIRPLPYPDAHRLFVLNESDGSRPDSGNLGQSPVAYPNYLDWRAQNTVFESLSILFPWHGTLTGMGPADRVSISFASSEFFRTLGVQPIIGRDFRSEEDRPGGPAVAIVSSEFCRNRFGEARQAVGKTITVDQNSYEIIGVLPAEFHHYQIGEITAPISPILNTFGLQDRINHNNAYVTGRLKDGISIEMARTEMTGIMGRLKRQYPGIVVNNAVAVLPLQEVLASHSRRQLLVLLAAVGMVLLIACANVASLFLADWSSRKKEFAVRAALGASRGDLARLILAQACLITLGAAILGVFLAHSSLEFLVSLLPWGFVPADMAINGRILLFTFGISSLAVLVFALGPAMHKTDAALDEVVKAGSGRATVSRFHARLRGSLIAGQIAAAVVVLVGAGLLTQSLWNLLEVEPGFEPEQVLTVEPEWGQLEGICEFYSRVEERLKALPGAQAVGAIWPLPLAPGDASLPFYREDQPVPATLPQAGYYSATPGYFATMRIPLKKGRIFTEADGRMSTSGTREEVEKSWRSQTFRAVVSESMARQYWPGEDPIGKRFRFGSPEFNGQWCEIIGVVGDIRSRSLEQPARAEFYISAYQNPNTMTFVMRSRQDPASLVKTARDAIREVYPNVPVPSIRTMDDVIGGHLSGRRAAVPLISGFAFLGLLLSAVGVYGLVSYSVAQRTYEIGVRMALGASRWDVLGSFVRQATSLAVFGLAIGLAGSLILTRLLAGLLFGVEAADGFTFVSVAALLIAVTFAATLIPARRAMQVDPITALRCQ